MKLEIRSLDQKIKEDLSQDVLMYNPNLVETEYILAFQKKDQIQRLCELRFLVYIKTKGWDIKTLDKSTHALLFNAFESGYFSFKWINAPKEAKLEVVADEPS